MTDRTPPGPGEAPDPGRRTGIVFCRCGPNLGNLVQLGELAEPARWPGAADVATHDVLCSPEGQAWLERRLAEQGLDRVVIAACSPREHERTFHGVMRPSIPTVRTSSRTGARRSGSGTGNGITSTTRPRRRRPVVASTDREGTSSPDGSVAIAAWTARIRPGARYEGTRWSCRCQTIGTPAARAAAPPYGPDLSEIAWTMSGRSSRRRRRSVAT